MLQNVSTLIFDLDGTISDPSLGIGRCLNYALQAHGFPEVSVEQVATAIGLQLDEALCKFCPDADQATRSSLVAKYRERYAEVGYSENAIYPGVPESLKELSAAGMPMGVCTSKRRDFAEKILAMFGVLSHFRFVDGGDIGIKKREQLAGLLQSTAIDHAAVMIGDREVDISSAKANGLRSVGVLWGFGSQAELSEASADVILSSTIELGQLGI
jgi:phosphoglycolate phosphatase